MTIEKPKFEKIETKEEIKEKLKKKIRAMTAWGIIALSSFGVLTLVTRKEDERKYKPKAIITDIEKKQPLSESEKTELSKKLEYLKENFGENIFPHLKKSVEANKESVSKPIEVKGFKKTGLSNEDLQNLWSEKYYPKGWIDDEISMVEYKGKALRGDQRPDYGQEDEETRRGATAEEQKEGKSKIKFYFEDPKEYASKKDFIKILDWVFSHESSHANDWESESQMDFKNRVNFLYEVSQNCFKEDALRDVFGYIDSIKNEAKNKENYFKVKEYWGSCCEYYFTFSEILKQDHPREFEMVDKYVKKEDPTFDTFKKKEQRDELIKQICDREKEKIEKQDSV